MIAIQFLATTLELKLRKALARVFVQRLEREYPFEMFEGKTLEKEPNLFYLS